MLLSERRFAVTRLGARADPAQALLAVPAAPGVGQILGQDARSLVIGMAANLRRWAAAQLGLGRPPRKGARPRVDLRPIARELRYATSAGGFEQRLLYERLMGRHVPLQRRRDLKTPAYLRLDAGERFPRLSVVEGAAGAASCFGPFRDRRAAAAARDVLNKRHALRPCDYVFEPDPALPLGLGCVFAQLRSCAAPCLSRIGEPAYRALAAEAAALLGDPSQRRAQRDAGLPEWLGPAGARALVVEASSDAVQLFPIRAGAVLDDEARTVAEAELAPALERLRFAPPPAGRDDTAWLIAWLRAPRRRGAYLVVEGRLSGSGSALLNAVRSALARGSRGSPAAS